jgi:hypothetical protein
MKKRLLVFGFLFALIVLGGTGFVISSKSPDKLSTEEKDEKVSEILGRKANLDPKYVKGSTKYEGKYISFSYPAKAKLYKYDEREEGEKTEVFSFDIESPRLILNYSAEPNRSDLKSLDDVPSVRLRKDVTRGYTESKIELQGLTGYAFSKEATSSERAEKTGFILKETVLHTVSVQGNNLDDVNVLFEEIIKSAEFK